MWVKPESRLLACCFRNERILHSARFFSFSIFFSKYSWIIYIIITFTRSESYVLFSIFIDNFINFISTFGIRFPRTRIILACANPLEKLVKYVGMINIKTAKMLNNFFTRYFFNEHFPPLNNCSLNVNNTLYDCAFKKHITSDDFSFVSNILKNEI